MILDELYNMWYDGNRMDPIFILMCNAMLQRIKIEKGVNYSDMIKCRQLSDGIRYDMEDWLYDNK